MLKGCASLGLEPPPPNAHEASRHSKQARSGERKLEMMILTHGNVLELVSQGAQGHSHRSGGSLEVHNLQGPQVMGASKVRKRAGRT